MDIQFYGANCVALSVGGARIVVDDTLAEVGGKSVSKPGDVLLYTSKHDQEATEAKLAIDMPGEYEVSDVSVYGIQARANMDDDKQRTAVMYKLIAKDLKVLVTGHIFPKLSESQLEKIGMVDVLIVPVGGNGFTVDPVGALELVKEIEPKLVIPTYFDDEKLRFEVPAQTLDQALQALGMEPKERTTKLKLKHGDLPESTQLEGGFLFIESGWLGCFCLSVQQTLLFEGTDSLGADLHLDLFAVDDNGLSLEVWLPDFLGVALRKADIAAVLLAFAGEFANLHGLVLSSYNNQKLIQGVIV
jgi:L-ascorbate metabolism protein UlaG (beta-lactamase superfamily)